MEEIVYDLVASGSLLSCGQIVLENTPAQELNPGFSFPPYSMIWKTKTDFMHGPNTPQKAQP